MNGFVSVAPRSHPPHTVLGYGIEGEKIQGVHKVVRGGWKQV